MFSGIIDSSYGAIQNAQQSVAKVAQRVSSPETSLKTPVRDTVTLSSARHTVEASAVVIRTADEMLGTIVDIKA